MQTFFTETSFADNTVIYDIQFEGIQVILEVFHCEDALQSSVLLITLEIITLDCGSEFLIKGFEVEDFF